MKSRYKDIHTYMGMGKERRSVGVSCLEPLTSLACLHVFGVATKQVAAALEAAHAKFGPVNAAVNCAGIAYAKKVLNKDGPHALDIFARTLTVNTVGTFNVCRLAAQHMSQQEAGEDGERGVLVNTAR